MMSKRMDVFDEIASFLPKEERIAFLENVIEASGSIYKASKITGISRPQIYRYLSKVSRRNYPSDEVTARILRAAFQLRPMWTRQRLKALIKVLSDTVNKI